MSRGLGRIQQEALDYATALGKLGKPAFAWDAAWTIANPGEPDIYTNEPTPALRSSVRRAVRALEKRGLVECGIHRPDYRSCSPRRLVYWLPGHAAPRELLTPIPSERVREEVLRALRETLPGDDMLLQYGRAYGCGQPAETIRDMASRGWYPYVSLRRVATSALGRRWISGREGTAVTRAVQSLCTDGIIKAEKQWVGGSDEPWGMPPTRWRFEWVRMA